MEPKAASLKPTRKAVFEWTCYGRLIEKECGVHGCEQARPDGLRSLFLRASRARTAQPSGPADCLCDSALGRPPFRCGETSGKANARCDALHLITAFGGASPQGEAFGESTAKSLPLEGKVPSAG